MYLSQIARLRIEEKRESSLDVIEYVGEMGKTQTKRRQSGESGVTETEQRQRGESGKSGDVAEGEEGTGSVEKERKERREGRK